MTDLELYNIAMSARKFAYAPYSKFLVGAAVLGADGSNWSGCNVENSSYGATICAERVALTKMVSAGILRFDRILIVTPHGEPPCGICLQVMREFAHEASVVVLADPAGELKEMAFTALMPSGFQLPT